MFVGDLGDLGLWVERIGYEVGREGFTSVR